MSLLTGVLKIQCTNELKEEIRKNGKSACVLIMDEIKNMSGVVDVWSPKDKQIDIIVEINENKKQSIDDMIKNITELDGVFKVVPNISVEI